MVLKAALIALLVAIATGWIAHDQSDPVVCLFALTLAFTAWLTFTTLMVLRLVSDAEAEEFAPPDEALSATQLPLRWNGTGTPRAMDDLPPGKGLQRGYFPEDEDTARC